jgi:hypothetical protein
MTNGIFRDRLAPITLAMILLVGVGCGSEQRNPDQGTTAETTGKATSQAKYDPPAQLPPAPEPAESPELGEEPASRTIDLGGKPEGLVADPENGLVAAGLRNPNQLALIDGGSGEIVRRVDLSESPRHLALATPGGPVLVPMERADELAQISLPQGEILSTTPVGAFPHDAAAAPNGRIFVLNEMESTIAVIEDSEVIETLKTVRQPGGVAATPDGLIGVIGVRGLGLEVFDSETLESLGRIDAGDGPTHVVAGPDNRFYVSDTRGGAVLVYEAKPELEQVTRLPLDGGSPYGISIDPERSQLWVTLTAENTVVQYDIEGEPEELNRYPTVRQPNTVAVNPASGRVFVAGKVESQLQILEP